MRPRRHAKRIVPLPRGTSVRSEQSPAFERTTSAIARDNCANRRERGKPSVWRFYIEAASGFGTFPKPKAQSLKTKASP